MTSEIDGLTGAEHAEFFGPEWYDEDDDEENLSSFAYQGFGPVCLPLGCPHWGGDNLCDLAISWMIIDNTGPEGPKEICPLA